MSRGPSHVTCLEVHKYTRGLKWSIHNYCMTFCTERALTFLLVHVTCHKHQTFGVCPRVAVISGASVQITHSCCRIADKSICLRRATMMLLRNPWDAQCSLKSLPESNPAVAFPDAVFLFQCSEGGTRL